MKYFLLLILIFSSASAIKISCYYLDGDWDTIGDVYTCNIASVDFSDNSTHVTEVTGEHKDGRSNDDVKMIWFSYWTCPDFNIKAIPKGLLTFFPNFIAFFFGKCSISHLNGDELEEYPNLQFYAHNNVDDLTRIPGNLFASTPNMKYIGFIFNNIEHVGEGLLDNLKNLKKVSFERNVCIDRYDVTSSDIPELINELKRKC